MMRKPGVCLPLHREFLYEGTLWSHESHAPLYMALAKVSTDKLGLDLSQSDLWSVTILNTRDLSTRIYPSAGWRGFDCVWTHPDGVCYRFSPEILEWYAHAALVEETVNRVAALGVYLRPFCHKHYE